MNQNTLNFIMQVVELETKRTRYYNGESGLLWECMGLERKMRDKLNVTLKHLREHHEEYGLKLEDIPEDVPERIQKKKK